MPTPRPNPRPLSLPEPFGALEEDRQALGAYLSRQRWFGSRDRSLTGVHVASAARLDGVGRSWLLCVLRAGFDEGADESFFMPVGIGDGGATSDVVVRSATGVCLHDAAAEPAFVHALLAALRERATLPAGSTEAIRFSRTSAWPADASAEPDVAAAGVEQSNTSIRVEQYGVLKLYRRLQVGARSPEVEVAGFLTGCGFRNTAPLLGSFERSAGSAAPGTALGVMFGWIANRGDAWDWALADLRRRSGGRADPDADDAFFRDVGLLGRRTAELHRALCPSGAVDAAFAPEPVSTADVEAWRARVRRAAEDLFDRIRAQPAEAPARLGAARDALFARLDALLSSPAASGMKTRLHGDYHLGQVLFDGEDFHIIDFEGEPRRSVDERRAKQSPLKDVAGMLRSFDYAAAAVAREVAAAGGEAWPSNREWAAHARDAFLAGYRQAIAGCRSYPADATQARELLELLTFEKAIYEIGYELAHRPDWVAIPIQGVLDLLASVDHPAPSAPARNDPSA